MSMPKPTDSIRLKNNEKLSADELKKFIDHHGISSREFADIFGVSEQAVKLWLIGKRDFSITNTRLVRMFKKYPQLIKEF